MRNNPDRENSIQETMSRIGTLSPAEGADVLLHCFASVLGGLDSRGIQQLREELTTRFGGRYCSGQVCRMMTDVVNGHSSRSRAAQS